MKRFLPSATVFWTAVAFLVVGWISMPYIFGYNGQNYTNARVQAAINDERAGICAERFAQRPDAADLQAKLKAMNSDYDKRKVIQDDLKLASDSPTAEGCVSKVLMNAKLAGKQ